MILFIYHDAYVRPKKHCGPAAHRVLSVQTRELFAHQMTLMQQQTVRRRQLVDAKQYAVAQAWALRGRRR